MPTEAAKKKTNSSLPPPQDEEEELGASMTFIEHLVELRERMIRSLIALGVAMVICFLFADDIIALLVKYVPHDVQVVTTEGNAPGDVSPDTSSPEGSSPSPGTGSLEPTQGEVRIIVTHPAEMLITWLKISFVAGIFVAFPFIFYEARMSIAPGLYRRERRVVLPLVASAWACFILGGLFCYFIIFPFALKFFAGMAGNTAENMWKMSEYLTFMIRFLLAFGIVFEEPVVIILLSKIGLVTSEGLAKFRPYAIVVMFTLAAIITPADPYSQIMCAVPLLILYEFSLWLVKINERRLRTSNGV